MPLPLNFAIFSGEQEFRSEQLMPCLHNCAYDTTSRS